MSGSRFPASTTRRTPARRSSSPSSRASTRRVAVSACADFRGPARRFQILGERGRRGRRRRLRAPPDGGGAPRSMPHASAIPGRRLIAIHTPHTYSRVSRLLEDYRRSFTGADVVIIGPIEEARERGMPKTVSSQDVADRAGPTHAVHVVDSSDEAVDLVMRHRAPGRRAPGALPRRLRQAGAAPSRRPGGAGCPRVTGSTAFPVCSAMSRSRVTASSAWADRHVGSSPRAMSPSLGRAAAPLSRVGCPRDHARRRQQHADQRRGDRWSRDPPRRSQAPSGRCDHHRARGGLP